MVMESRVISFLPDGSIIDGDIEALLLVKLLRNNSGLILTKMSDIAIINYLKQSCINISISDVGDKMFMN